jgi:hypothetical protein
MVKKNPHETKTHNYLLRSTRRDHLLDLMVLVHAGRVKRGYSWTPIIVKADGTWAGNCEWALTLENRGFIQRARKNGETAFELTTYGHAALSGALASLGRQLDTTTLLAQIDTHQVY